MTIPLTPLVRPRRLRTTPAMRRLVAETRINPGQLVLPVFVADGLEAPRPIGSLPGVVQHSTRCAPKPNALRRPGWAASCCSASPPKPTRTP